MRTGFQENAGPAVGWAILLCVLRAHLYTRVCAKHTSMVCQCPPTTMCASHTPECVRAYLFLHEIISEVRSRVQGKCRPGHRPDNLKGALRALIHSSVCEAHTEAVGQQHNIGVCFAHTRVCHCARSARCKIARHTGRHFPGTPRKSRPVGRPAGRFCCVRCAHT